MKTIIKIIGFIIVAFGGGFDAQNLFAVGFVLIVVGVMITSYAFELKQ